jgi:hypothetical protein
MGNRQKQTDTHRGRLAHHGGELEAQEIGLVQRQEALPLGFQVVQDAPQNHAQVRLVGLLGWSVYWECVELIN